MSRTQLPILLGPGPHFKEVLYYFYPFLVGPVIVLYTYDHSYRPTFYLYGINEPRKVPLLIEQAGLKFFFKIFYIIMLVIYLA